MSAENIFRTAACVVAAAAAGAAIELGIPTGMTGETTPSPKFEPAPSYAGRLTFSEGNAVFFGPTQDAGRQAPLTLEHSPQTEPADMPLTVVYRPVS